MLIAIPEPDGVRPREVERINLDMIELGRAVLEAHYRVHIGVLVGHRDPLDAKALVGAWCGDDRSVGSVCDVGGNAVGVPYP